MDHLTNVQNEKSSSVNDTFEYFFFGGKGTVKSKLHGKQAKINMQMVEKRRKDTGRLLSYCILKEIIIKVYFTLPFLSPKSVKIMNEMNKKNV